MRTERIRGLFGFQAVGGRSVVAGFARGPPVARCGPTGWNTCSAWRGMPDRSERSRRRPTCAAGAAARPIRSSPTPDRIRRAPSTRGSTANAAGWGTASGNANPTCSPTACRAVSCMPTNSVSGSPPWPICCSAPSTAPAPPPPLAARSADNRPGPVPGSGPMSAGSVSPWLSNHPRRDVFRIARARLSAAAAQRGPPPDNTGTAPGRPNRQTAGEGVRPENPVSPGTTDRRPPAPSTPDPQTSTGLRNAGLGGKHPLPVQHFVTKMAASAFGRTDPRTIISLKSVYYEISALAIRNPDPDPCKPRSYGNRGRRHGARLGVSHPT